MGKDIAKFVTDLKCCIYCSRRGKKHPKDNEDELHTKFPQIIILKSFTKSTGRIECKCEECGYVWQHNPYSLFKSKGCPKCKNDNADIGNTLLPIFRIKSGHKVLIDFIFTHFLNSQCIFSTKSFTFVFLCKKAA